MGRGRRGQVKDAAQQVHGRVGRRHVNVTGVDTHPVGDGDDRYVRRTTQDGRQKTRVVGREMLHDDQSQVVNREPVEQRGQRLEPAGRGADADDGKRDRSRGFLVVGGVSGGWVGRAHGTELRGLSTNGRHGKCRGRRPRRLRRAARGPRAKAVAKRPTVAALGPNRPAVAAEYAGRRSAEPRLLGPARNPRRRVE